MGAVLSLIAIAAAALAIVIVILRDIDAWIASGREVNEEAQPEASTP